MTYELWDRESGNQLGVFDAEREALALVQEIVEDNGIGCVDTLVLGVEGQSGRTSLVASGRDLLGMAHAQLTA